MNARDTKWERLRTWVDYQAHRKSKHHGGKPYGLVRRKYMHKVLTEMYRMEAEESFENALLAPQVKAVVAAARAYRDCQPDEVDQCRQALADALDELDRLEAESTRSGPTENLRTEVNNEVA